MSDLIRDIPWSKLNPIELSMLCVNSQVCSKCGVTVGENKNKYCGNGSDKDNPHRWSSPMTKEARIAREHMFVSKLVKESDCKSDATG